MSATPASGRGGRQALTLRARVLLLGALIVAGLVGVSVVLAVLQEREEAALGEALEAFSEVQRLSDQMGRAVMLQILRITDLDADLAGIPSTLAMGSEGGEVQRALRALLDRPLPEEVRSTLERLREAHQVVETAAARATILSRLEEEEGAALARAQTARLALDFLAELEAFAALRSAELEGIREQQATTFHFLLLSRSLAVGIFLLLGGAIALSVYRRLARALDNLLHASAQLGEGDLTARVPRSGDPEFDVVADGFNRMADRLSEALAELERRNGELADALAEVRQAQGEVIQAEKMAALGRMAAGLAHELNNPLGAVLGFAELLDQRLGEPGEVASTPEAATQLRKEYLTPVLEEGRRARDLIQTILQFSRRTVEGQGIMEARSMLGGAFERQAPAFVRAGLVLEAGPLPEAWIPADPRLFESIVMNLVGNARDAMEGTPGGRLRVHGRLEEGVGSLPSLVLLFDDEGPGFTEPDRAFEPFYTTKAPGKGTGLGLPLVHRFVEGFGGGVSVENRAEGGARVRLEIPTLPPPRIDPPPAAPGEEPADGAAPDPFPSAPLPLEGSVETAEAPDRSHGVGVAGDSLPARVLVVDDEPALRHLQARILKRMGIEVLQAASAEEARATLGKSEVRAIVSDVRMPGGSGVTLYRELLLTRPSLARRFLFITGDRSHPELEQVLSTAPPGAGARGKDSVVPVLVKPFSTDAYREAVSLLLQPDSTGGTG